MFPIYREFSLQPTLQKNRNRIRYDAVYLCNPVIPINHIKSYFSAPNLTLITSPSYCRLEYPTISKLLKSDLTFEFDSEINKHE